MPHLQVVAQGAHDLLNLLGQLTGGGQHQSLQDKRSRGNMNKVMISSQLMNRCMMLHHLRYATASSLLMTAWQSSAPSYTV